MLQYFNCFKKAAFRLELLQAYDVKSEKEAMTKSQQTGQVAPNKEWGAIIQAAKQRGAEMKRVHIVEEPYSDYLNFELAAYEHNRRAGEQIYTLKQSIYDQLGLTLTDFWLNELYLTRPISEF